MSRAFGYTFHISLTASFRYIDRVRSAAKMKFSYETPCFNDASYMVASTGTDLRIK